MGHTDNTPLVSAQLRSKNFVRGVLRVLFGGYACGALYDLAHSYEDEERLRYPELHEALLDYSAEVTEQVQRVYAACDPYLLMLEKSPSAIPTQDRTRWRLVRDTFASGKSPDVSLYSFMKIQHGMSVRRFYEDLAKGITSGHVPYLAFPFALKAGIEILNEAMLDSGHWSIERSLDAVNRDLWDNNKADTGLRNLLQGLHGSIAGAIVMGEPLESEEFTEGYVIPARRFLEHMGEVVASYRNAEQSEVVSAFLDLLEPWIEDAQLTLDFLDTTRGM